jgi:O-antigen ligase
LQKLIVYFAVAVTILITPVLNKDSMIVPKAVIIFCFALYVLPVLINDMKNKTLNKINKVTLVICVLIVIQIFLVMIMSDAPFEQQLYGRTGRGLGAFTLIALLIIFIASILYFNYSDIKAIFFGILISSSISSIYSIIQYFRLDGFNWDTKTNGIIGTLGNPNFQSSFAALSILPSLAYFLLKKYRLLYISPVLVLQIFVIYIANSTQGYIGLIVSISVCIIIYLKYKSKKLFYLSGTIFIFLSILAVLGTLNRGPLSYYLYKVSVQSRGDFWRSAVAVIQDHPIFGVGLDSFGDYYLKYRDLVAISHPWTEYTDNSHNYFLEFASTAGLPLAVFYFLIILITFGSFVSVLKKQPTFDLNLSALFVAWIVLQLQSLISPGSLVLLTWNFIISGLIISIHGNSNERLTVKINHPKRINKKFLAPQLFLILGIVIMYPYFNVDRLQAKAMQAKNGNLAINSTLAFPKSTLRFSQISRELLASNLPNQSLELAREAIKFNPNSAALWALILINPSAPYQERENARSQILNLDPLNQEVKNFLIE